VGVPEYEVQNNDDDKDDDCLMETITNRSSNRTILGRSAKLIMPQGPVLRVFEILANC